MSLALPSGKNILLSTEMSGFLLFGLFILFRVDSFKKRVDKIWYPK